MKVRRKSEIAEAVQQGGSGLNWKITDSYFGAIYMNDADFAAHYEPVPEPPAQMRKFLNEYSSATNRAAFEPFPEPEDGYPTLTIPRATLKRWRNDYVIFRGALAIICEVEFDKLSPFDIEAAMQRMKSVSEEPPAGCRCIDERVTTAPQGATTGIAHSPHCPSAPSVSEEQPASVIPPEVAHMLKIKNAHLEDEIPAPHRATIAMIPCYCGCENFVIERDGQPILKDNGKLFCGTEAEAKAKMESLSK